MSKLILFLVLFLSSPPFVSGQEPIAYLFFDEKSDCGNIKMFASLDGNTTTYAYADFSSKVPQRRHFDAFDNSNYKTVDSIYFKQLKIKPPSWHFDKDNENDFGLEFDKKGNLTDKDSYYKQIFIVEKLDCNAFKIIQVVPYIGEIYYAPMR